MLMHSNYVNIVILAIITVLHYVSCRKTTNVFWIYWNHNMVREKSELTGQMRQEP